MSLSVHCVMGAPALGVTAVAWKNRSSACKVVEPLLDSRKLKVAGVSGFAGEGSSVNGAAARAA